MSDTPARPRQATLSAWMIMGGSVFVVLSVFERVSGLTSLETRESVEDFLAVPPGDGLGLDTSEVLDLLRVLAMTAGACAAAAAVLGYFVLQRSRGARLALSVLALPLFLTGMAAGGFVSSIVAAAVVVLWMQPTRSWFDGTQPPERPERPGQQARQEGSGRSGASGAGWPPPMPEPPREPAQQAPGTTPGPGGTSGSGSAEPRAWQGFGTAPGGPQQQTAPQRPHEPQHPARLGYAPPPHDTRPANLVWACALTWAGSGLAAVGMGMAVLVMLAAPDLVLDQLSRSPELSESDLSRSAVRDSVVVTGAVVVLWSLAAAVVAAFAWRGARWARTALLVSAALAAALCLLSVVLGSPVAVLPFGVCVAAIVLLGRPDVRAFFAAR
ncbi:hypothetical protein [Nocardioides sp. Arc9.136]|uniref:hypothetical protein n=1 Tax=Nocardioides sp. Arc9.136 TaxID=2996826 RepID=UPI0026660A61|nr:hypothetical protein [Nocardioides sp. Arc9.136]WKN48195.1 hypothetical protein OSR43_19460 [Nocardioides sp. Arc9.136]